MDKAEKMVEETPQDGIAPPAATGSYQVDESVIAGKSELY